MKNKFCSRLLALIGLGVVVAVCAFLFSYVLNRSGDPQAQMAQQDVNPEIISKGAYLARAGDCVACHTSHNGGKPFAGGLGIKSPIGTIYSTNITPDNKTGIGRWSYGDFERAVRRGIGHNGDALYPAMPFPSYAMTSDEDTRALYAYFMYGVPAVSQENLSNDIPWPLSIRWPLAYWRTLFAPSSENAAASFDAATSSADPEIARGAYLVQGLGHCGSCHTPRALTMQEKGLDEKSLDYLAGAELNGWAVTSIRGVSHWSHAELVDYLGTGRNEKAAVAGEMTDVVANSTSHMTDADLGAIAKYLQSLNDAKTAPEQHEKASGTTAAKLTAAKDLTLGERLYIDNCNACHLVAGNGAPRVFPRLDGASVVNAENAAALIEVILAGAETPSTARAPSVLPMPGFAYRLSDSEAAELATFVRQAWSNKAGEVSEKEVRDVRARLSQAHGEAFSTNELSKPHN